jgi:hypothetical protein
MWVGGCGCGCGWVGEVKACAEGEIVRIAARDQEARLHVPFLSRVGRAAPVLLPASVAVGRGTGAGGRCAAASSACRCRVAAGSASPSVAGRARFTPRFTMCAPIRRCDAGVHGGSA